MKKLKILFFGSPQFAATSLRQLISDGYTIIAVVTGQDKKQGRGQITASSPVKICAIENSIPVYQPSNLKDEEFYEEMKSLDPDLGIVVAFRMLPEKIWSLPKLGTINLHASLLPNYRGAAPINWAIINGENTTGLTTFFLKHEIDTGDIIDQKSIPIEAEMTAGKLHDLLMNEGAILLSQSVESIEKNTYSKIRQQDFIQTNTELRKAPKIYREDCKINWKSKATDIKNLVRGMNPLPGAWSILLQKSGKELIFKVYRISLTTISSTGKEGEIIITEEKEFLIGSSDYFVQIELMQIEGKRKMTGREFLLGYNISETTIK